MAPVTLIGLSGYARSGKDTAGRALVEAGWVRISFADKLREFLYALNPYVADGDSLREIIDNMGWETAKDVYVEVRELLQRCGTEAGRKVLGENVWVDAALRDLPGRVVVTDCRFPNEAEAIKDRGGLVVRIARPGFGPTNPHPSETALDYYSFDAVLRNDGTTDDLQRAVHGLLTERVAA